MPAHGMAAFNAHGNRDRTMDPYVECRAIPDQQARSRTTAKTFHFCSAARTKFATIPKPISAKASRRPDCCLTARINLPDASGKAVRSPRDGEAARSAAWRRLETRVASSSAAKTGTQPHGHGSCGVGLLFFPRSCSKGGHLVGGHRLIDRPVELDFQRPSPRTAFSGQVAVSFVSGCGTIRCDARIPTCSRYRDIGTACLCLQPRGHDSAGVFPANFPRVTAARGWRSFRIRRGSRFITVSSLSDSDLEMLGSRSALGRHQGAVATGAQNCPAHRDDAPRP